MSRFVRNVVLDTNLLEHPAVKFWHTLSSSRVIPEAIIILKEYQAKERVKSAVYRLKTIGPAGIDVIAKRCKRDTWMKERTIYEIILPNLPVPSLQCFGFVEEPNGKNGWLFLQDAGDEVYLPDIQEHRTMAAQWLGLMHTKVPLITDGSLLPDRGPAYYLEHLKCIQDTLLKTFNSPALDIGDLKVLQSIVSLLDIVKLHWKEVEQFCNRIPRTLVHCDFVTKNVRLQNQFNGLVLLALDWEMAGWGVPAVDISRLDISTYWSVIQNAWSDVDLPDLQKLANFGELFWCLVSIIWDSTKWVERAMMRMKSYESRLSAFIKTAGWSV